MKTKLSEVFYGWWIVVASAIIFFLLGGFVTLSFTAFFDPIANEFGWSYAQISLASSIRGIEVGLLAPLMGILVDRWGSRWLVFGGVLLIGVGLIALGNTVSLATFYGAFVLIALGTSGASPTVMLTTIATWFRKKVGIATGLATSGFAFGGILVPVIVRLIDVYDWRHTLFILATCLLVVNLPLSLILRHRPEQYGLLPDGEKHSPEVIEKSSVLTHDDTVYTRTTKALSSRDFWHIGIGTSLQFLTLSAVGVHVMPYLNSVGITRSVSSLVAMALPLISIVGRLGAGILLDKFSKKRIATVFYSMPFIGLLFFSYVTSELYWLIIPFVVIFGIGSGANTTIRASLIREYFGSSRFGVIFGFMMGMVALSHIVGPLFAGWVYDKLESYQVAWLVLAATAFIGMLFIVTIPSTNRAEERAGA